MTNGRVTNPGRSTAASAPGTGAGGAVADVTTGRRWRPYLIALLAVVAAALVREAFAPLFGPRAPFWTFHIALVISAWVGGLGPGLLATALGGLAAVTFFAELRTVQDVVSLCIYCFIGLVVSSLTESLHRSQARARRASADAIAKDVTVRDILARTTDAIAVFDTAWRVVHANERAVAMMRRSADAIAGVSLWDIFPQTIGSELQHRLTTAMATQAPDRFESFVAGLDLWAEIQVFPSPAGATLFISDTTAAHAAARQRAVLAAINEAARSPGGGEEVAWAIVCEVGRLMGVARCTVADVDEAAGVVHVFRDYLDGVASIAGTHRLADFGEFLADEVRHARTTVVDDVRTDPRINAAQRAAYAAFEIGAFVTVVVVRDGRATGQFNVHSVTPRQWSPEDIVLLEQAAARTWAAIETARATAALRQSEERLRLALDAGQLGVWDWDLRSGHVTWSDRVYDFHGVSKETFSGRMEPDLPLTHPDDRAAAQATMQRALRGEVPYRIEYRALHPDGEVRWLFTSGSVFRDDAGNPVRVLGATIDITERKRLEEQREQLLAGERSARADAERAGRMKDEFLATLSHELRTPLNAIYGWAQIIRSGKLPPAELQYGLDTIERNAKVQTQLIDDLLDMSRIISGKVRLEVSRLDLADVAAAAVATVRPTADAKEIHLQSAVERGACYVSGDVNRLQQVVWNLLSNAIKFTPRGGQVRLAMRRNAHDGFAEVEVTDSGQGISPEFLPHVFDRFRQADGSTTRRHGGLGLGLSIVKQLVEMHGGSVRAASPGAGHGASFTIALPLIAAPDTGGHDIRLRDLGAGFTAANADAMLAGLRVLVVDDEPDARELIARLLTDAGATVSTASNAAEAIAALADRWPLDVLVSDIGLPGEDGYAMIRQVRARHTAPFCKVPAVALTAYARSEDRTRAILAGFQVHLSKPVEPTELLATVASLAGRNSPVGVGS